MAWFDTTLIDWFTLLSLSLSLSLLVSLIIQWLLTLTNIYISLSLLVSLIIQWLLTLTNIYINAEKMGLWSSPNTFVILFSSKILKPHKNATTFMSSRMGRIYMLCLLYEFFLLHGVDPKCGVHFHVREMIHTTEIAYTTSRMWAITSCKSDRWQIIIIR